MRFPLNADLNIHEHLPLSISLAESDRSVFKDFVKSTLIYIRNLGLKSDDLDLSFEGFSYDEKCEFMNDYLFGEIRCKIKELDESWAKAIRQKFDCDCEELKSIFSQTEQEKFIGSSDMGIKKISQAIKSGVLKTAKDCNSVIENTQFFPVNTFNVLETYGKYLEFIPWCKGLATDNRELTNEQKFQIMNNSKSVILMYGKTTADWDKFIKQLNRLYDEYKNSN